MFNKILFFFLLILFFIFFIYIKIYGVKGGIHHPKYIEKIYNKPIKRKYIYFFSFGLRIILPILLFTNSYLNPINAMIINQIIVDNLDPIFLIDTRKKYYNRKYYQLWDKCFDIWGYLISLYPILFLYKFSYNLKLIFISLFIYRCIGLINWLFTFNDFLFIYFPDLYTSFYYVIFGSILFNIKNKTLVFILIWLSLFSKIFHEIYNHS
jgi:hypothetical protein